jgi:hypothetical protein
MLITMAGVIALEQFRIELEEDAGEDFPQDVIPQLLILYDVCRVLDLNIFQTRDVLGHKGWACIQLELNSPVGKPTAKARTAI